MVLGLLISHPGFYRWLQYLILATHSAFACVIQRDFSDLREHGNKQ
jgi:hypothetical protein